MVSSHWLGRFCKTSQSGNPKKTTTCFERQSLRWFIPFFARQRRTFDARSQDLPSFPSCGEIYEGHHTTLGSFTGAMVNTDGQFTILGMVTNPLVGIIKPLRLVLYDGMDDEGTQVMSFDHGTYKIKQQNIKKLYRAN